MSALGGLERPRVVVTQRIHRAVADLIEAQCELVMNHSLEPWTREELMQRTSTARGLMVFMPDSLDEQFLCACSNLQVVAGALKGCDNFDVAACTRLGIWFTVVADLLSEPTAELALALLLALARNVTPGDRLIRGGNFQGWRPILYGKGLAGSKAGLIGLGSVGRALARMLAGFACELIYFDPVADPQGARSLNATPVPLDDLLRSSDFVLPLVPLTPETFHLVDRDALRRMKSGSYLVNVSRGSVVDEEAVAEALESGHLAGYAADTFEMEDWALPDRPRQINSRLLRLSDRTVFTPHLGSAVARARLEIERAAATNILEALRGERPSGAFNNPVHPRNRPPGNRPPAA